MGAKENRRSQTVWLKPRHLEMLRQMPETNVGDITRRAIEDAFEGRHDREFARIVIEDDLAEAMAEWKRVLGLESSCTVTSTEDGFSIRIVGLKTFNG